MTCPGQRTKAKVRIEPSVASPSSPRKGPGLPMSGGAEVAKVLTFPAPRAVVGGEDQDRVVLDFEVLQRVHDLPDVIVALHHLVAVLPDARFAGELPGRIVRRVTHRERQIEEEGFARRLLRPS